MSRASLPWWVRLMQSAFSALSVPSFTIYLGLTRQPTVAPLPLGSVSIPTSIQAALSFFLLDVIKAAPASIPASSCSETKFHAHDVREAAASLLMRTNSSFPSILRAACWRTPSVFTKPYLRGIVRRGRC